MLSDKRLKEAKVYLVKIKVDWFKIKGCVDGIPSNKRPMDKSASSHYATDTKRQDRRASRSLKDDEVKM